MAVKNGKISSALSRRSNVTNVAAANNHNSNTWRLTPSTVLLLGLTFVALVLQSEPPQAINNKATTGASPPVTPTTANAAVANAVATATATTTTVGTAATPSSPLLVEEKAALLENNNKYTKWERLARQEQADFCQTIANQQQEQQELPRNTLRVSLDTTQYGGTKYDMIIYHKQDVVSRRIRRDGAWDRAKTEEMIRLVQEHAKKHQTPLSDLTFVDIGGNVGWFTLVMASLGLNVITVEPMSFNLELLRRSLCLSENKAMAERVVLHGKGVSNAETTCTVYSQPVNVGDGTLACGGGKPPQAAHQTRLQPRGKVQVLRVDDLIHDDRKIVALKMDTEGHEALVVEGGTRLFLESHIPLIFTEFNPSWIRTRTNRDPLTFMHQFVQAGYSVRVDGNSTAKSTQEVMDMNNWNADRANEIIFEYAPKLSIS